MSSDHHQAAAYVSALLTHDFDTEADQLTAIYAQLGDEDDYVPLLIIGALAGIVIDLLEKVHPDHIERLERIADLTDAIRNHKETTE